MKRGPPHGRNVKVVGYLRPERADELKALAQRSDRTVSWWLARAVDLLLRSQAAQLPDTAP